MFYLDIDEIDFGICTKNTTLQKYLREWKNINDMVFIV